MADEPTGEEPSLPRKDFATVRAESKRTRWELWFCASVSTCFCFATLLVGAPAGDAFGLQYGAGPGAEHPQSGQGLGAHG